MVLTGKAVWLIGRQKVKSGPNKGQMEAAVNRKLELEGISKVNKDAFDSLLKISFTDIFVTKTG